ncbi:MAG: ROK family glucokinase [Clostridia bacterium]|nr:ROK family glucokinase [Clostridia bacterium]
MYIGIDLGGTNIAAGIVDENGNIICKGSVPTLRERGNDAIVADMANLAIKLVKEAGLEISDIKSVGIGCPGTIDNDNGVVVFSNNIVMEKYPLVAKFREHLDLPVNIENDANAAAYGEYIFTARDKKSFVLITLGTGVGGGIIIDGKLWRGFNCAGAELGHSTIIMNGKPCTCGKKGCFEAYASVTGLIDQTREAMEKDPDTLMHKLAAENGKINGRTSFDAARAGDKTAIEVRDQYIRYVAEGVGNIINMLQPEVFVIGGGISREGDTLLEPLKEIVYATDYNRFMPKTEIRIAKLFGDAGIVGAALAAKK